MMCRSGDVICAAVLRSCSHPSLACRLNGVTLGLLTVPLDSISAAGTSMKKILRYLKVITVFYIFRVILSNSLVSLINHLCQSNIKTKESRRSSSQVSHSCSTLPRQYNPNIIFDFAPLPKMKEVGDAHQSCPGLSQFRQASLPREPGGDE